MPRRHRLLSRMNLLRMTALLRRRRSRPVATMWGQCNSLIPCQLICHRQMVVNDLFALFNLVFKSGVLSVGSFHTKLAEVFPVGLHHRDQVLGIELAAR